MDKRVESFLERVEKQIYTEHESDLIREELSDHIECLVEDYVDAGYSADEAVSKALFQMGDPKEIGYSFTDYDGMKKRKYIMLFFRVSAIFGILLPFVILLLMGGDVSFFPVLLSFTNIYMSFTIGSILHGQSLKFLELDTTPYMILWPTKERFKWEYFIMIAIFSPLILLFVFAYFYDHGFTSSAIIGLWPIFTIIYGIWALWFSEKFRIPKYMVIDDGFIIKGRLVSWTAIKSYSWSKDFLNKKEDNYRLVLTSYITNGQQPFKKTLNIHKRQQQYLQRILREKMS